MRVNMYTKNLNTLTTSITLHKQRVQVNFCLFSLQQLIYAPRSKNYDLFNKY